MEAFLFPPVILFITVVVPIWLVLHYKSKRNISQGLTDEEYDQLTELSELADTMADRIKTLEAILDAETPEWRNKL